MTMNNREEVEQEVFIREMKSKGGLNTPMHTIAHNNKSNEDVFNLDDEDVGR